MIKTKLLSIRETRSILALHFDILRFGNSFEFGSELLAKVVLDGVFVPVVLPHVDVFGVFLAGRPFIGGKLLKFIVLGEEGGKKGGGREEGEEERKRRKGGGREEEGEGRGEGKEEEGGRTRSA